MSSNLEEQKKKLKDEIDKLRYEMKVELPRRIQEAREYGDLKENAEYHAARERQGFVKARIAQLSHQLSTMSDIDISSLETDSVDLGSQVTVKDLDTDEIIEFSIVPTSEVDPSEGKISLSSPIGRALHKKAPGDEVHVQIPAGTKKFFIENLVTIHGKEFTT